jgi:hypothetical protein
VRVPCNMRAAMHRLPILQHYSAYHFVDLPLEAGRGLEGAVHQSPRNGVDYDDE